MGGTFMSLSEEYRDYFIRNLHDALSGHKSNSVEEAVKYSERSNVKCIGITIETRPDYCLHRHLSDMLKYGCTRLEIGKKTFSFSFPFGNKYEGHLCLTISLFIMILNLIQIYRVIAQCYFRVSTST